MIKWKSLWKLVIVVTLVLIQNGGLLYAEQAYTAKNGSKWAWVNNLTWHKFQVVFPSKILNEFWSYLPGSFWEYSEGVPVIKEVEAKQLALIYVGDAESVGATAAKRRIGYDESIIMFWDAKTDQSMNFKMSEDIRGIREEYKNKGFAISAQWHSSGGKVGWLFTIKPYKMYEYEQKLKKQRTKEVEVPGQQHEQRDEF